MLNTLDVIVQVPNQSIDNPKTKINPYNYSEFKSYFKTCAKNQNDPDAKLHRLSKNSSLTISHHPMENQSLRKHTWFNMYSMNQKQSELKKKGFITSEEGGGGEEF